MLLNGPYPWELKERIASQVGTLIKSRLRFIS